MLKFLFLTHRYLGIALGLVMLLWCLSGFVMMYKPYPELNQEQQLETLALLDLSNCCVTLDNSISNSYERLQVMMLGGSAVLHLYSEDGEFSMLNLATGEWIDGITEQDAVKIATGYALRNSYSKPSLMGLIETDQWTVYNAYNIHRPLYQFEAKESDGTQWYISSQTGEIVQITTRSQRIWGYLGAVIHWVYPRILRQNTVLWNQVVIALSLLGTFLTVTGIYFGFKQFKIKRKGRRSPYKGLSLWHHYSGLVFGVLTLSWIVSGLFSMQPWGLFESSGAQSEAIRLKGRPVSINTINKSLDFIYHLSEEKAISRVDGNLQQGELFWVANLVGQSEKRFDVNFVYKPLSENELEAIARKMLGEVKVKQSDMLYKEDNYYYSHHDKKSLPVYKVVAADRGETIYYLDSIDGGIISKVDSSSKGYRWFHLGLHRLDFIQLLRARPYWDILMCLLLSGVTIGAFTGCWLGFLRLKKGL